MHIEDDAFAEFWVSSRTAVQNILRINNKSAIFSLDVETLSLYCISWPAMYTSSFKYRILKNFKFQRFSLNTFWSHLILLWVKITCNDNLWGRTKAITNTRDSSVVLMETVETCLFLAIQFHTIHNIVLEIIFYFQWWLQ